MCSSDLGSKVIVGVNRYVADETEQPELLSIDPTLERTQCERLAAFRAERDQAAVDAALTDVRAAAQGTQNLLYPMKTALAAHATLGEVSDVLRDVFGLYTPTR